MIPTFIIFFRETLELALIIGILLAALKGVSGRNTAIVKGVALGIAGALVVAWFADVISNAMEGMGQELMNGSVLLLASGMIGWTVIWMRKHAREIMQQVKEVGTKVARGQLPLYAVTLAVALAALREGAETVLFMFGVLGTTTEPLAMIIAGAAGGLIVAAAIGAALYLGLVKLSVKYLFAVTSWMLVLLASGMAAHAAGYLAQGGYVPELTSQLWDTSWLLSEESWLGVLLHTMIGYIERPSGIQGVFYAATFAVLFIGLRWQDRKFTLRQAAQTA